MAGSLADLYCLSGQWAVALPLQQLALKADSDSAQILRLAVIQRNVGLIKEARRSIETAIQERRPTAKSPVTPGPRLAECIEEYGKILIADGMPADEVRNYIYKKYNFIDDPGESQP